MKLSTVTAPFHFNEDFQRYTRALYELKAKHPNTYIALHEYATTLIHTYDAVQESFGNTAIH